MATQVGGLFAKSRMVVEYIMGGVPVSALRMSSSWVPVLLHKRRSVAVGLGAQVRYWIFAMIA